MRNFCVSIVAMLLLAACRDSPYANIPDEELHAKALLLPLPQRYDLYVDVLHSSIPSRPILAIDIAALGDPAWIYTLDRALSGGTDELLHALPVLSEFKRACSTTELEQLQTHAKHVTASDQRGVVSNYIETACKAGFWPTSD